MWNYVKLRHNESPMAEILGRCSNKANINLVVYHLSENHVECATVPNVDQFRLGETARAIKADSRHNHAILAFDLGTNEVYKIEDVPELPVASAVLLCVVTELLNGNVQPRENEYGRPEARKCTTANTNRDASGRFVKKVVDVREPNRDFENDSVAGFGKPDPTVPIITRRFKIGRR